MNITHLVLQKLKYYGTFINNNYVVTKEMNYFKNKIQ